MRPFLVFLWRPASGYLQLELRWQPLDDGNLWKTSSV